MSTTTFRQRARTVAVTTVTATVIATLIATVIGAGSVVRPGADERGASVGQLTEYNLGAPGHCTEGAYRYFHEATGLWPKFDGNAAAWNDTAPGLGWTVVLVAQPHSIVVFERDVHGASIYGHVAWVETVEERADGRWVTIRETNADGAGRGTPSTRTVRDLYGMSYILAPVP
jgi:surface antigen